MTQCTDGKYLFEVCVPALTHVYWPTGKSVPREDKSSTCNQGVQQIEYFPPLWIVSMVMYKPPGVCIRNPDPSIEYRCMGTHKVTQESKRLDFITVSQPRWPTFTWLLKLVQKRKYTHHVNMQRICCASWLNDCTRNKNVLTALQNTCGRKHRN